MSVHVVVVRDALSSQLLEPLSEFQPNLTQSKFCWRAFKFIKMTDNHVPAKGNDKEMGKQCKVNWKPWFLEPIGQVYLKKFCIICIYYILVNLLTLSRLTMIPRAREVVQWEFKVKQFLEFQLINKERAKIMLSIFFAKRGDSERGEIFSL